jgi:hypothetical protein
LAVVGQLKFPELRRSEAVAAIRAAQDIDFPPCLQAFEQDSVSSYTMPYQDAESLRKTLELKYSIARQSGLTFTGDDEVFLRLSELGPELVTTITTDFDGALYLAFFRYQPLEYIGCVVMRDATRGQGGPPRSPR